MEQQKYPETALYRILTNPWFGALAGVCSIIGLLLSIYFYLETKESVELTYTIDPIRTSLVRADQSSRLRATFDGQIVDGDITVAQVTMWNRGSRPIKNGNMLKPIRLSIPNGRILETTVSRETRDVIGVKVVQTSATEVEVKWNILEKNDGFRLQLIYIGKIDFPIDVMGIIEGQASVNKIKTEGFELGHVRISKLFTYSWWGMTLVSSFMMILVFVIQKRLPEAPPIGNVWWVGAILLMLFCFAMGIFRSFSGSILPPLLQ